MEIHAIWRCGWKALMFRLPGIPSKGAFKVGWIDNPEAWLKAMERPEQDITITYNESMAEDVVYMVARQIPGTGAPVLKETERKLRKKDFKN